MACVRPVPSHPGCLSKTFISSTVSSQIPANPLGIAARNFGKCTGRTPRLARAFRLGWMIQSPRHCRAEFWHDQPRRRFTARRRSLLAPPLAKPPDPSCNKQAGRFPWRLTRAAISPPTRAVNQKSTLALAGQHPGARSTSAGHAPGLIRARPIRPWLLQGRSPQASCIIGLARPALRCWASIALPCRQDITWRARGPPSGGSLIFDGGKD